MEQKYIIIYFADSKMSSSQQKKCNQCLQQFSMLRKPFQMPKCRHNVCQQCLQEIKQSKVDILHCQFCDAGPAKMSKTKFEYNRLIMNKFKSDSKKKNIQNSSETSVSMNASMKAEIQGNEEQDYGEEQKENSCDGNQFLLTEDTPDRKKMKELKKGDGNICAQHEKPYEIVCVTDLCMICSHCAIFGNHKDHCFKTIKQFNKDYQSKYAKIQVIKQQKYVNDKKLKQIKQKSYIQQLIDNRRTVIRSQISKIFQKLTKDIEQLQVTICEDLNKHLSAVYKDIVNIFQQESKITQQYNKWEQQCENNLSKIAENSEINEKIKLMYNPLVKISQGQQLVDRLDKKLQLQTKKIDTLIANVGVEFRKEAWDLTKFIKVGRKDEKQGQGKKDNFMQSIEKLSLPMGKHVIEDFEFGENSFLADYQKQQFSMILDSDTKRAPTKSVMSKRSPLTKTTVAKYRSPNKKTQAAVPRSPNSNTSLMNRVKSQTSANFQSQLLQNTSSPNLLLLQTSLIKIQIRQLQPIVADFLKHDLKQVLDLSRCDLNDETVVSTLKQIRRHRKIRGLKLCQNYITDAGFENIIDFIGSTSNLNISYNKLTEQALSIMIKNRDKISPLRIVNLSFNNVNQKKGKTRIDALKKMGIIVNV